MAPKDKQGNSIVALLEILRVTPVEDIEKINFANVKFGALIRDYISPPDPEDCDDRSSIREDVAIREIGRMIHAKQGGKVRILDACCGLGSLPRRILRSISSGCSLLDYYAIDRDPACVEAMRTQAELFKGFGSIRILQREVSDLIGFYSICFDLIILNNSLHEISPSQYPQMFQTFNKLLCKDVGEICIIDMVELPEENPEANAINWTGEEIKRILVAGGLDPQVTVHPKRTDVYQAHIQYVDRDIDEQCMKAEISGLLRSKIKIAVQKRKALGLDLFEAEYDIVRDWLVLTGLISRCAEELCQLEGS
jgi:SAM-dependent methyltransferase